VTVEVRIVGFGRRSERVAFEAHVPPPSVAKVRAIAKVPASDPDLTGSYPLDRRQIAAVAEEVHIHVDPSRLDYFLEAYAD
jgi:hypothetical protein